MAPSKQNAAESGRFGYDAEKASESQTPATIANKTVFNIVSAAMKTMDSGQYKEKEPVYENTDSNNIIYRFQRALSLGCASHGKWILRAVLLVLFVGYSVYFGFAIAYNLNWSVALIVFTSLTVVYLVYAFFRDRYGDSVYQNCWQPIEMGFDRNWFWIKWLLYPALMIAIVVYVSVSVVKEVRQLQSLSGFVLFFIIIFAMSKHPTKINYRPVVWGYAVQFVMAIIVLRWRHGYIALNFLAEEITKFLNYGYDGAGEVFGDPWFILHQFAFMGMPLLIYVGAVMSVLYYMGVTQWVAQKIAFIMQKSMQTTAIETLNVAANIFLSGNDTMLMLRNYLPHLTLSEVNLLVVGNQSTVAGLTFALFVMFGAPAQHLLSAAVMSAPAAVAIAKLCHPETQESVTKNMDDIKLSKSGETNVFEVVANGSAIAGKTVAAVVLNFIAFLSMLAFVNATLSWLGGRVGFPELSFQWICSYLMWPIALVIGIDVSQCREVAKIIGIKLFSSEVLAYQELGQSAAAGLLSERSRAIATYAICGYCGLSNQAIVVGIWGALCPQRRKEVLSIIPYIFIQANIACFTTACIAGLFYTDETSFGSSPGSGEGSPLIELILGIIPGYKDLLDLIGF